MANEEVIRENMERTRESLTEKLEALENKVIGSVSEATSAVRETVSTVKETMHEGVESVKDAVDIPAHVERHPWLMFGGAVFGGYLLSSLVAPSKSSHMRSFISSSDRFQNNELRQTPQRFQQREAPTQTPAKEETPTAKSRSFFSMLEPEINQLKGLALGMAFGAVRELVAKEVPEHLAEQVRGIVDGVTTKMGGHPIGPDDLPFGQKDQSEQFEQSRR